MALNNKAIPESSPVFGMKNLEAMGLEKLEKIIAPTILTFDKNVKEVLLAIQNPEKFNEVKQDAKNDQEVQTFVSKAEVAIGGKLIGKDQVEVTYFAYTTVSKAITEHLKESLLPEERNELLGLKPRVDGWMFEELHNLGLPSLEKIEKAGQVARPPEIEAISSPATKEEVKEGMAEVDDIAKAEALCLNGRCKFLGETAQASLHVSDGFMQSVYLPKLEKAKEIFDINDPSTYRPYTEALRDLMNELKSEVLKTNGENPATREFFGEVDLNLATQLAKINYVEQKLKQGEITGTALTALETFAKSLEGAQSIGEVIDIAKANGVEMSLSYLLSILSFSSILQNSRELELSVPNLLFYNFALQSEIIKKHELDSEWRELLSKDETRAEIMLAGALSLIASSGASNEEQAQKKAEEQKKRTEDIYAKFYPASDPAYIALSSISATEFLGIYSTALPSLCPEIIEREGKTPAEFSASQERAPQDQAPEEFSTDSQDGKRGSGVKIIPLQGRAKKEAAPVSEEIRFVQADSGQAPQEQMPPALSEAMSIPQFLQLISHPDQTTIIPFEGQNGISYAVILVITPVSERASLVEISSTGAVTSIAPDIIAVSNYG